MTDLTPREVTKAYRRIGTNGSLDRLVYIGTFLLTFIALQDLPGYHIRLLTLAGFVLLTGIALNLSNINQRHAEQVMLDILHSVEHDTTLYIKDRQLDDEQ